MENTFSNKRSFHLAGIIPVAGQPLDYSFPWHDSLQPISANYLAIERSVLECAYAGCKTIWVVCNDDMQPLVRSRLGDFVVDPQSLERASFVKYPEDYRKQIPIFYCPVHPKDRDRRDSFAWSVLHGALSAFVASDKVSKWVHPNKYYISFPYGVYDPIIAKENRKLITGEKSFFLSHKNRTVSDGEYLGFTMDATAYKQYVYEAKQACTGGSQNLPIDKRWSSRHFRLDKIFNSGIIKKESVKEIDWYYNIDSWEKLSDFYASEHRRVLHRPSFMKTNIYKSIEEIF